MAFKYAASRSGFLGLLLPLLVFFIAADSAYACPQHNGRAVSRTKLIKTKSASRVAPVVITYGGQTSMRCGDNLNATRRVRYVESRDIGTRYVAVRRDDGRKYMVPQTRYVAVRRADVDVQPRYVAVRRSPAYADNGVRYVAVRNTPTRVKYVAVRDVEVESPRYVAVRRAPVYDSGTRYVAVRNVDNDYYAPRTKYVAVRNVDSGYSAPRTKYVAVRDNGYRQVVVRDNGLDMIEAPAPRHVVVRTDYIDGTEEMIVPNSSYTADAEYLAVRGDNVFRPNYVAYSDRGYTSRDRGNYVMTRNVENSCMRQVAVRTCPDAMTTRTVSYVPVTYENDYYDQALIDGGGTTYVVADDIENACLSRMSHRTTQPVSSQAVSYVPVDYADDAYMDDTAYIVNRKAAHSIRYVDEDDDLIETDVVYIDEDSMGGDTLNYATVADVAPIDDIEDVDYEPVRYVSNENVRYVPQETVSYVPARNVSYLPVNNINDLEAEYIADDDCMPMVSSRNAGPVYVAESPAVVVEVVDSGMAAGLSTARRVAAGFGYRDGFKDGRDDALDNDAFRPETEGDYRKATNGYERKFGSKDVYRDEYRNSYLEGYRSGYTSIAGSV
jgi:hypothetical protein